MDIIFKRLLLVNPGKDRIFSTNEPLNLALLAAFVQSHGVEVVIADELSGQNVLEIYRSFQPDIVGITATSTLIKDAYAIAEYFRERKVPTVLGGVHASTLPNEAAAKVPMIVKGEGEYPLLEILAKGSRKGVFSSDKVLDINAAPLPARDLLNIEYYLKVRQKFPQDGNYIFVPRKEPVLSVMITRGCPWNCAFCHNMWRGLPFRIYSPQKVIEELNRLRSEYGLTYFIFRDDNIFSVKAKIRQILIAMIDAGLGMKWGANARVDCLDEELLALAKKAGCRKLNFGFESGSQDMLDKLDKKTNIEKIYSTVQACKTHKIQVSGSFIVGHPDETKDDVLKTRAMIRRLKLDSIGIAIATPFPGTAWWRRAAEQNLIPQSVDWSKFDFDNVPIKLNQTFSVSDLKRLQRACYIDACMANPAYVMKLVSAMITNPRTLKKRIQNILGKG